MSDNLTYGSSERKDTSGTPYDGRNDDDLAVPGLGDELRDRPVGAAPLGSDVAPAASPVGAGSSVEPPRVASAASPFSALEQLQARQIATLEAEIKRLQTRGGIARSLIPVAQVEKFHRRCKELGV